MNDQVIEEEKPKELIRVEKLINEGKHKEALQLMNYFEEKEELTPYEIVSCKLLKCELFFQQGLCENVIKLAQQTYEESLDLGNNFLSADALLIMANAFIYLYELEKAADIIKQGEGIIKKLSRKLPKEYQQREASMAYTKGRFYERNLDFDLALEHLEHSLALREKFGTKQEVAESLLLLGYVLGVYKGELDRALECVKQGMVLVKENNNKYHNAWGLNIMAAIYSFKGELDRSIILYEQSLVLFKELNSKTRMTHVLNNIGEAYRKKGELDRALECLEQCLALNNEVGILKSSALFHDLLIQILIDKGDMKRAQQALHDLEQMNNELKDKRINLMYLFDKALMLKTSPRARNRVKAKEILKQILDFENLSFEDSIRTLLNLCDILLNELHKSSNLELLDEIQSYITQILDIAKTQQWYWLLVESYLLQSKLDLIKFDLKRAQETLAQAKEIAEKYNMNQLVERIAIEQKELFTQSNKLRKLKDSNKTIVELSNLNPMREQIQYMLKKRQILKKLNS